MSPTTGESVLSKKRVGNKLGPIAFAIAIVALVVFAADVFLLIFAGLLLSIFLESSASFLNEKIGIPYGWSLAIFCVLIVAMLTGGGYFVAPSIARQADELSKSLPQALNELKSKVEHYTFVQKVISEADPERMLRNSKNVLARATGVFSTFLGWVANFVIILFIGLYGSSEPGTYKRGFLHLVPKARRHRIDEVIAEVKETLQWWLIGKFFGMTVIGALTTLGLWIMDIPLALILGLIAALLTFIPNIGPILSAVPAIILGLAVSPEKALYIALLYFGIQVVESYVLTPLVQRKTVELPPALSLSSQVLLGVVFGALGVALATPLTAAALVITRMLYVEDYLEDHELQSS